MLTASRRYDALQSERNWYLNRARTCSALTLPYLIPSANEPGKNHQDTWVLPWTGVGQQGVKSLASKLLMALLPPTETFFRLALNEVEMERSGLPPEARSEMEKALSRLEQEVLKSIEATNDRVAVHEALLWLIVAGNSLLYAGKEGLRVYHLNRYVMDRDPMGNPLELVVSEELAIDTLPEAARKILEDTEPALIGDDKEVAPRNDKTIAVYTWVRWEESIVRWHQEIKGQEIPGSQGQAPKSSCPWIPLRMSRVDGSSYGVSYVESAALADLQTADALQQAVVEGSLASAKLLFLVKPSGVTKAQNLAQAANGAFVPGDRQDVESLQGEKAQDLRVAAETLTRIEARLSLAFMLSSVRDSERTTAEEVRLHALELENALGSVYSILSTEFQAPYINRKLDILMRAGKIPALPRDMVRPVVSVGLAAVGRSNELEKLMQLVTAIGQTMPQAIPEYIKPGELIKRMAYSLGIPTTDLVRTDQEIAEQQQQAQQQALAQQMMASPMADPQKQAAASQMNAETLGAMGGPPSGNGAMSPEEALA